MFYNTNLFVSDSTDHGSYSGNVDPFGDSARQSSHVACCRRDRCRTRDIFSTVRHFQRGILLMISNCDRTLLSHGNLFRALLQVLNKPKKRKRNEDGGEEEMEEADSEAEDDVEAPGRRTRKRTRAVSSLTCTYMSRTSLWIVRHSRSWISER